MWDLPDRRNKKEIIFVGISLALIVVLFLLPHEFKHNPYPDSAQVKALVLEVDNSDVQQFGIVRQGEQSVTAKLLKGEFEGQVVDASNTLLGTLELDKMFAPGQKALVTVTFNPETRDIVNAVAYDHYRIHVEQILLAIFILLLLVYAQWTGLKALISFFFTALMIWKVLLPGFLRGWNPILLALVVDAILTGIIIYLVAGINRKGTVAFLGGFLGILLTAILAVIFGKAFYIHGAVVKFSETLLYSGFAHLDLTRIFLAGIFIAASGAVMDIAMDISASMHEVHSKHPDIPMKELILSGFRVGRSVLGTMTTTLLLAYSSSYTAMLMVFIAQGTPLVNVFNITYVSAEILHTLVGSFGLVTVAPFTAFIGGVLYSRSKTPEEAQAE